MITRPVLLASLALAVMPATACAAPWSAPRSVTVSGTAREPTVALGGPDAAAIAYVRHLGRADRVELRQGTVDRLRSPVIIGRENGFRLDSPTLTYSGHTALLVWRRFSDELNRPPARVLELASVLPTGVVNGRQELTGPPNTYEPAFPAPGLLTFWRRSAAYVRTFAGTRPGVTTRLPAGAAFESQVARVANGALVAVWPNGGAIFAATQAPGAIAFGPVTRLSAPGGFARTPKLAVTSDGHAVAVWTQSEGTGRALMSASAPAGGAFGAPTVLAPASAQALTPEAIGTTAGDVLVTFVSARSDSPAGPLQALRVAPDGHATTPVLTLTLTPPGERTRDAALAVDSGAGYAAWVTAGVGLRHRVRVVRIAPGGIVGTVRTVSGSDAAVSAPPAFAMTTRGRALIGYATQSQRIRLVTRRPG
jgi:hypothetical protein